MVIFFNMCYNYKYVVKKMEDVCNEFSFNK